MLKILSVIDTHCVLNSYPDPQDKHKILRILDCIKFGEYLEEDMRPYDIHIKSLFVGDSRPYWRQFHDPNYKANRPKRSLAFPKTLQLKGYEDSVYIERFEADDIAGLIWRNWPKLRAEFDILCLHTVDSDWCQLLTDQTICVLDLKGYLPAYRSSTTAWIWVKNQLRSRYNSKKSKVELEAIIESCDKNAPDYWATVIRTWKWRAGDKCDNILPMADRCMTDLTIPPHGDFGLELDSHMPHINSLLAKQKFIPAKYCQEYVESCIVDDHNRIPLVDRRAWEEMKLKKFERPDLLAFMR